MPFYMDEALKDYSNTVELQARGLEKKNGKEYTKQSDSLNYGTIAIAPFNSANFNPSFGVKINWSNMDSSIVGGRKHRDWDFDLFGEDKNNKSDEDIISVANESIEKAQEELIKAMNQSQEYRNMRRSKWYNTVWIEQLIQNIASKFNGPKKDFIANYLNNFARSKNPFSYFTQKYVSSTADNYVNFNGSSCSLEMPSNIVFSFVNKGDHYQYLQQVFNLLHFVLPTSGKLKILDSKNNGGLSYTEEAPNEYRVERTNRTYEGIYGDFRLRVGHIWYEHVLPVDIDITRSSDVDVITEIPDTSTRTDKSSGKESKYGFDVTGNIFNRMLRSINSIPIDGAKGSPNIQKMRENAAMRENKSNSFYAIPHVINVGITFHQCVKYFPDDIMLTLFNAKGGN